MHHNDRFDAEAAEPTAPMPTETIPHLIGKALPIVCYIALHILT